MKKSIALLFNTGYLLIYMLLTVKGVFKDDDPIGVWLVNVLNGMVPFFTFYFLLVPRFLAKKKFLPFIGWGIVVIIVAALIPTALILFLSRSAPLYITASIQWELAINSLLVFSIFALLNGIMATVIKGFFGWYNEVHERTELEKTNLQMELSLLKTHLNPHFLFNTLNNIDILIETDPKAASSYLQKLSDILRFVVYETSQEKVLLTKELAYIRKYVELQQIRTTNKQYVNLMIAGDPGQLMIGPMLFIPFIENAFKHASNKKMNGAITLEISIADKQVRFNCTNLYDKAKSSVEAHSGLGIALIRQRFDLLYKDHYELEINQTEDTFRVTAVIKLDGH
jgi:sensor histidine kinase YesM